MKLQIVYPERNSMSGFPPRNAGASLKQRSIEGGRLVALRFPPRNAGASLKPRSALATGEVSAGFPPRNAGASLKHIQKRCLQERER